MQETEDKEGVYLQSFSVHRDMLYYARRVFMDEAFEIIKTGIDFFCSHLVFFNMLFAIVIVFFRDGIRRVCGHGCFCCILYRYWGSCSICC